MDQSGMLVVLRSKSQKYTHNPYCSIHARSQVTTTETLPLGLAIDKLRRIDVGPVVRIAPADGTVTTGVLYRFCGGRGGAVTLKQQQPGPCDTIERITMREAPPSPELRTRNEAIVALVRDVTSTRALRVRAITATHTSTEVVVPSPNIIVPLIDTYAVLLDVTFAE